MHSRSQVWRYQIAITPDIHRGQTRIRRKKRPAQVFDDGRTGDAFLQLEIAARNYTNYDHIIALHGVGIADASPVAKPGKLQKGTWAGM